MTLIDIARRDRSKRDSLLKLPTAILFLDDVTTEKQDLIRGETVISMDNEGVPTVSGFKDSDYVEHFQ